jgi:hypothetical protein
MVYTNNIPQPADNISTSQQQILGNFQFLADTAGNTALGNPGYYIFPNGLKIQYATVSLTAAPFTALGGGNFTLTNPIVFPVPFITEVKSVQISIIRNDTADKVQWIRTGTITLVNFNIICNNTAANAFGSLSWFAIGV